MTEAMQAIISFAGQQMGVREIRACIYVENERSIRLLNAWDSSFPEPVLRHSEAQITRITFTRSS